MTRFPVSPLVALALVAACSPGAPGDAGHHDVLVTSLRQAAPRPLVAGDTLVTWTGERPVLFHLSRVGPDEVETALVRLDGMVGTAKAEWSGAEWRGARGTWRTGDGVETTWSAERAADGIRLRAARDTVLATPALPFAIADHGMDDQLVPLLRTLPAHGAPQAVAAYRPHAARWDTLTFEVRDTAGVRVIQRIAGDSLVEVAVLPPAGGLLATLRIDGSETRPLDGSPAAVRWRERFPLLKAVVATLE